MSDMDVDDFDSDVEFSDPEVYDSEGDDNELGLSTSIEIRRPPSFEALDEAVLLSSTTALLQEVSDILSMPRPTALILMRQYKYATFCSSLVWPWVKFVWIGPKEQFLPFQPCKSETDWYLCLMW